MRQPIERGAHGHHASGWFRALAIAALVAGAVVGGLSPGVAEPPPMDPAQAPTDPKPTEATILGPVGTLQDLVVDEDQRPPDAPGSKLTAAPLIPVTVLDPVQTLGTD